MYQISSPEICHKALVIWSSASLQSLLSIPSSSSTLNSFPPQSLCLCCSLYLVCCSPTPHVAAPTQEDSPSVTLPERALFGLPKQKHPLLFFLIENIIFPSEHVSSFVIIFMFVPIW